MLSKSSKITIIIVEIVLLLFLVASIYMIIEPDEEYGASVGWFCLVGVLAGMILIPFKLRKEDTDTTCPRCKEPGGLVVTNRKLTHSEPIVKTENY